MGAASSISRRRRTSRRQFFRDKFSCLVPRGGASLQAEVKVIVFSHCTTDFTFQCAVSLVETSPFAVRVHATTNDYDNIQKLGDKVLLNYLNKELFLHKVDFNEDNSVEETIQEIFNMEGVIDVLVCHLDEISNGPVEECQKSFITSTFEKNFFNSLTLLKASIPIFKSQKSGQIICINTIAGVVGLPNYSIYSSARFAIERLLESLASECLLHDIKVSIVQTPIPKACNRILELHKIEAMQDGASGSSPVVMEEKELTNSKQLRNLHKDIKPRKIVNFIQNIIQTQNPYFRYIVDKECVKIIKEKLRDVRGTHSINEVSKFFLHVDLDDVY